MTPDQLILFAQQEFQKLKFANTDEEKALDTMTAIYLNMLQFEKNDILTQLEEEKRTILDISVAEYTELFDNNFTKKVRDRVADNAKWLLS
jgi:hypothetical protein